jgi:glycerophosphoryl diester phosphodiesterase
MRTSATLALFAMTVFAACGGDDGAGRFDAGAPRSATVPTTEEASEADERAATVVAHRGASAYAPEHTFAAYDLALEQGADYIEQDLQLTADGELVVLHDETLDRTARGPAESCTGPVHDKTLEQLRQCDMGSWFNEAHPDLADPAFVGLKIPTMREVIERYGDDARYYVETKAPDAQPGMEQALLDLLDETTLTGERATRSRRVIVQSFSAESLQRIRERQPELPLVLLLYASGTPIAGSTLDDAAKLAIGIGPSSANVDAALVDAAHERCLDVHPYTVDDPAAMSTLLAAGVDGMFTNAPDVLRAQRSQAPAPPTHCT